MAKKVQDNVVALKTKKEKGSIDVDFTLLFCILLLLMLGLTMVFSTSSAANMMSGDVYDPIIKQALLSFVGLILMFIVSRLDYRYLKPFTTLMYLFILGVMLMVGIWGVASHGAVRQISLGPLGSIQPSEFSKYFMILWLAMRFSSMSKAKLNTWREFLITVGGVGFVVMECIVLQRHASGAIIHLLVGVAMIVAAGVDWKKLIPVGLIGCGALVAIILTTDFRTDRITSYFHRGADLQGADWQSTQSLYAVGSGGLFGLGLGNSRQKYSYLPEAENDYIFAIVCEELGFIGALLIIIIFCIVIWRGISIALNCRDAFGTYAAFGITVLIGFQVLINMCVVLHLIPSTGMQLPLFSSGGSSVIAVLGGFGILLSISRENIKNSKGGV
ncbi:MAG: FtsW/RodA/SpoVE family cell cycle protein [Clostridia bacterium]